RPERRRCDRRTQDEHGHVGADRYSAAAARTHGPARLELVRVSAKRVFSARSSGLVGAGRFDDAHQLVLDCYRLSRWFAQNPEVFLAMPLSNVRMHIHYAAELARLQQQAAADSDG